MTYYRIKKYCVDSGMTPGKAEYARQMIRRLVQQKEAENADREIITLVRGADGVYGVETSTAIVVRRDE